MLNLDLAEEDTELVLSAGIPTSVTGTTNMMQIRTVESILDHWENLADEEIDVPKYLFEDIFNPYKVDKGIHIFFLLCSKCYARNHVENRQKNILTFQYCSSGHSNTDRGFSQGIHW